MNATTPDLTAEWQDIRVLLSSRNLHGIDLRTIAVSLLAYESDRSTFFSVVLKELFRLGRESLQSERNRYDRGRTDGSTLRTAMRSEQEKISDFLVCLRTECAKIDRDFAWKYFPRIIIPEYVLLYYPHDPLWRKPGFELKEETWIHA